MSKVFISYSHDSPWHVEHVLQFANALRSHGVDVEIDRYHVRPPKGWPHWCEEQLRPENSDFVLMICTETYFRRVQDQIPADEGLGVFWEGSIIHAYIYGDRNNERFIPILLDGATKDCIPISIREHAHYQITSFDLVDRGYESLYRELTGQRLILKPPLGTKLALPVHTSQSTIAPLAPGSVQTTFPIIAPSRLFRHSSTGSDLIVGREDELKALDLAWSGTKKKNVITIVAWGGVGKTSLVAHWAAKTLAKKNHGDIELYFDWSFYSQGMRTDDDATGADKAVWADVFVKEALGFFGDPDLAVSSAGAWQKGERLAGLVAKHRTLLILDGLEPLQDAKSGDLRDEALRPLLRGLAADNRGLCLVTTRQRLPELISYHLTTAPEWELAKLSKDAGAELLRKLGVRGTLAEREQLSRDVKGHALTLTLLGKYLAEAHGGDIRKRDLISLTDADYEEASGHAFHVMEAYERWLEKDGRRVELAILNLLGLFDRPASPDCLVALRHAPAIPGLTETLAPLADAQWNLAVKRLVQLGVVEEQPWEPRNVIGYSEEEAKKAVDSDDRLGAPKPFENPRSVILNAQSLDAHPLIREYFGRRLRETSPESWQAAHSRLFEHLRSNVPYWPEGLDGLQTLYQAVAHGCQAGRYQEACDEVYRDRILRGTSGPNAFYSSKKLGAVGADFAAVNCFFVVPLTRPAQELAGDAQVWLLSEAALALRALGRLTEARQPMQIGLERSIEQEDWKQVAIQAGNISELDLTLGEVVSAVREAEQSVAFADRSGDAFQRIGKRTTLADAQHQAGRSQDARTRFEEAEVMQRERHRGPSFLYSLWGFRFCDLLLADVERAVWRALMESPDSPLSAGDLSSLGSDTRLIGVETAGDPTHSEVLRAVEQRSLRMFEWNQSDSLLEIGLDHLTLARVAIYRAILEPSAIDIRVRQLPSHIAEAVLGIRRANALHHLPRGLLTSAWQWSMLGQTNDALADLSEAQQVAERGPMRLHLADVHLHRARLFFRGDLAAAREDLKQARILIDKCGYLRRMQELEDAEKVILAAK